MRALVNIKDLISEGNRAEKCPKCDPASEPLRPVQVIVDWRKGRFFVRRTMNCPDHGPFTIVAQVKTVLMHGPDAQVF